jgi:DUF4097 and DUF4098 domain-containing protein YvlB
MTGLLLLSLIMAACAPNVVQGAVQEDTFSVGRSSRLAVVSDGGNIDVIAGPPGVIVVQTSFQKADLLTYEVTNDGDTVTVTAKQLPGLRNLSKVNRPAANITITAPRDTFIDIATGKGDIAIEGMRASGKLTTSGGSISLDDAKGGFEGGAMDGDINIFSLVGKASFETLNGTVSVKQSKGAFELATSDGHIYFQGELTPGGRNGFLASNGNVVVEIAGEPSLRILASALNGEVTSSPPLTSGSQDSTSISDIIGLGEAELIIEANNGTVTLN